MKSTQNRVLTINSGSSSIKFAVYESGQLLTALFYGEIKRIGWGDPSFSCSNAITHEKTFFAAPCSDHASAVNFLLDWLEKQNDFDLIQIVGHRIVHGMRHTEPEEITDQLLEELHMISVYDPEHLPDEISLIQTFRKRHPELVQIACFDTSFHASMPSVAKLLSIPRRFADAGVARYGFHGLSYEYLMEELTREGIEKMDGRILLVHLGNGASMVAVKEGKSLDTSMGFTPASGLVMSTRTGDLDPGVAWYLMQSEKMSPKEFGHLINHESGLLGVSETSADMEELLKHENTDIRAADAVSLFCYQAKKWIGSFSAVLGGFDTVVFSGGIGENSAEIRRRICSGLGFLGIELDENKNSENRSSISSSNSPVSVRVIHTNEELMIGTAACRFLNTENKSHEKK